MDDAAKITITKEANGVLGDALLKINKNFEGGKVNRQILASWLIEKAAKDLSDADIKSIRADNFNALNALSAVLRKAQETGIVPAELKHLLFAQVGLEAPAKKNAKSKLTKDIINDEVALNQ